MIRPVMSSFFSDQRLQTQTSVINAAARWFVAIEAGQTGGGRIEVYSRCNSKIDNGVVTKAPKPLQERKIDRSEPAIGSDAEIVGAGFDL